MIHYNGIVIMHNNNGIVSNLNMMIKSSKDNRIINNKMIYIIRHKL